VLLLLTLSWARYGSPQVPYKPAIENMNDCEVLMTHSYSSSAQLGIRVRVFQNSWFEDSASSCEVFRKSE